MLDQEFYRLTLIFVNLKLFEELETAHPKYFQSIIGIFLLPHFFNCIKKKFNNVTKLKKDKVNIDHPVRAKMLISLVLHDCSASFNCIVVFIR